MDELIPTRATLLARLRDWKDQVSWADFFETYWRLIYRVALKAGLNEEESRDVVQETMFCIARQMPSFKYDPKIGSFKAWLLNLTQWRIADQFRKRGPHMEHRRFSGDTTTGGRAEQEKLPAGHPLDAVWEAEWKRNIMEAAVDRVKRRCDPQKFQIFDLYVNKEWETARVASAFGLKSSQVYLIKHRITEMIKEEVERLESEMQ